MRKEAPERRAAFPFLSSVKGQVTLVSGGGLDNFVVPQSVKHRISAMAILDWRVLLAILLLWVMIGLLVFFSQRR